MAEPLLETLDGLSRVAGVRGALLVDSEAGVPVTVELTPGLDGPALAALAGSLFQQTGRGGGRAGFGALEVLQLEARDGHLLIARAGELLLVVLTEPDAPLGLVRLQVRQAAAELA